MGNKDKYYERFIEHLYTLLKNKGRYKDENGFCIIQGKEPHSYYIQSLMHSTKEERKNNPQLIGMFINDFSEHLFNNKPFKLLRKDEKYYDTTEFSYDYFLEIFVDHLYDASRTRAVNSINPTIEQFTKVIQCFAPIIDSIRNFLREINYHEDIHDNHYNEFIYAILSLPNHKPFNKNYEYYASDINDEIFQLDFYSNDNLLVKNGIINYLKNREDALKSIVDKDENYQIYDHIKTLIEPKYWEEVALFIPNLNIKKKNPLLAENLFSLNEKPIYQIDLNRDSILNISQTIVTDKDLFEIINLLNKFINLHKPEGIDYILPIHLEDKLFLVMSGEKLNKEMVKDIGGIFEKMIKEYNSDSIIKVINTDDYGKNESNDDKNEDYLNKAAANFWLEFELPNSEKVSSNKKVKKI
jgi:uncharacterized protein YqgQ